MEKKINLKTALIFSIALLAVLPGSGQADPNLVAHWKLDYDVTDSTANNNDGTIYGNPTYVGGMLGQALDFNGVNDYVKVPDDISMSFGTGSFSIAFWVKVHNGGKILINGTSGGSYSGKRYTVYVSNSNIQFDIDDAVTKQWLISNVITDDVWHHVVCYRDVEGSGGATYVYCDSEQIGSKTSGICSGDINSPGEDLYIGCTSPDEGLGSKFTGQLDDIRLYNKVLDQNDIDYLANLYAWGPSPEDGEKHIPVDADLSWNPGMSSERFDVYFGTDESDVNDANTINTLGVYKSNQDANSFDPNDPTASDLLPDKTYYWRIDSLDDVNNVLNKGDIWNFDSRTTKAYDPDPEDNLDNVMLEKVLSWSAGSGASTHDVYFGTDQSDVNDANTTSPLGVLKSEGQSETTFDPNDPTADDLLLIDTTYYWRIDEVNADTVTGDVWSFTTTSSTDIYNVKDYGATGNGSTLDTDAINDTITAAYGAGGGRVYFPTGTYKSGSIVMKDNITLDISANAILLATDTNDYNSVDDNPWDEYQDWGHSHWKSSLIWGIGVNNVAVTGTGLINGNAMTAGDPADGYGDRTISFKLCSGILIKDISIYRAGHFAIITMGCNDVTIDNVLIDTNRDGINIDCCNDVNIVDCIVNSPGDDAICMKSSYGLGYKRPTENVTISRCTVMGHGDGYLLPQFPEGDEKWHAGRIKFGTESNGGFKNITITDCNFEYCYGFMLATVDGGDIENINIDNIQMTDLFSEPIFMRLGNRARGPGPPPPGTYRNINISNITAEADHQISSIMSGMPGHCIEDVNFSNINIVYPGGGTAAQADTVLPENEKGGPDAFMFGTVTPSYAFYVRHAKDVEFHNCSFDFDPNDDERPAFVLIDVNGFELDDVNAERSASNVSHITFDDVDNLNIHDCPNFPAVTAIYTSLDASPNTVNAGDPFTVTAPATADSNGVCTTVLTDDPNYFEYTWTEYIWLNDGVQKDVEFADIKLYKPGHHELTIGTRSTIVDVCPVGDFDLSGNVNLDDYATFANDWLEETEAMSLPNDPVAWWKFEEGSGDQAYDSSVNNNTGTLYNMNDSNWVTGYDGGALDFNGIDAYIRVTDSASISVGASDYTLCAWIYPHTISHRVGIVTKTEGSANKEYAFYVTDNNELALEVEVGSNDGIATTNDAVVQIGEWQHVMVAFDASTTTPVFYYNFEVVPGGFLTALPTVLDNDLYIGMWGQGYLNANFDGVIDDVRIYNYQLQPPPKPTADFNEDDIVDFNDLGIFSDNWLADID